MTSNPFNWNWRNPDAAVAPLRVVFKPFTLGFVHVGNCFSRCRAGISIRNPHFEDVTAKQAHRRGITAKFLDDIAVVVALFINQTARRLNFVGL